MNPPLAGPPSKDTPIDQPEPNGPRSPPEGQDRNATAVPSLSELTHLLRLEKYQSRKCRNAQQRLYQSHILAARTTRLANTARSVQRTLADCIKSEDKASFASLFYAFLDAISDCSEGSKGGARDGLAELEDCQGYPSSFVDALPPGPRTTLFNFLTRIRQDGDFIANRLAALTQTELFALLPDRNAHKNTESVFGSSSKSSSRASRLLGFVVDGQTDLLTSLEFASPLETLVHSVRPITGRKLTGDKTATDVWASVCARLISGQNSGSGKVVPAVIDLWATSSPWPGQNRFELWLSQILQDGAFLLDQPPKQSFRVRIQGRPEAPPEDEIRQEKFYETAVNSFLDLLGSPVEASIIPEGASVLCQAIYNNLSRFPGHQQAFPDFVIARWLFPSFILDAITLPEASISVIGDSSLTNLSKAYGLLVDRYISENARQRILREIASRAQKAVFDVLYHWWVCCI